MYEIVDGWADRQMYRSKDMVVTVILFALTCFLGSAELKQICYSNDILWKINYLIMP